MEAHGKSEQGLDVQQRMQHEINNGKINKSSAMVKNWTLTISKTSWQPTHPKWGPTNNLGNIIFGEILPHHYFTGCMKMMQGLLKS